MRDILNKKDENTVKRIHLLTTKLCSRNCPYCCNNLYDIESIPCATTEELNQCEWLFLTGGEPFLFVNPSSIAKYYKNRFKNIKYVIVYGNVYDCYKYLGHGGKLDCIDGLSLSIKNNADLDAFASVADNPHVQSLSHNRLYVFGNLNPKEVDSHNFDTYQREWQSLEKYKPSPDSIFRRM